ncbi:MAG: fimbrillin family protein, partial [Phocaeicola sp.]
MMNKKFFLPVVALALAANGCTKHDVLDHSDDVNPLYVNFSASIGAQNGEDTTADSFKEFCVYGYQGESGVDTPLVWNLDSPTSLMTNETVTKGSDEVWTTASSTPWPAEDTQVQFFAFSPAAGATYLKNSQSNHTPALHFTANKDVTQQVDLLYAESAEMGAAASGNHKKVALNFTHALTKFRFSAKVQPNQKLYISSISLHNLAGEGSLAYATGSKEKGSWSDDATTNTDFRVLLSDNTEAGITATDSVSVTAADGAALVIPQVRKAIDVSYPEKNIFSGNSEDSYIKVVYSLQNTTDGNWIVGTGSEVENQVTAYIPRAVAFDINKSFNFVIDFGVGNGGYDNDGEPIIAGKSMIDVEVTFTDWDEEEVIDVTPPPAPKPKESKMSFTVLPTQKYGLKCHLPFSQVGKTGAYTLTVDWGDGTSTELKPGTPLSKGIEHTYAAEVDYIITITSSEEDFKNIQVPKIEFSKWGTIRDALKSIDTPLLNTGAESFSEAFAYCPNLKEVSEDLFVYNREITDFSFVFNGSNLQTVPENLFKYNKRVTNFRSAFYCSKIETVPENLFEFNTNVADFSSLFDGSELQTIPADLFKHNVRARDFDLAFSDCASLKAIPAGLFNSNREATSFARTFAGCALVETIPTDLFKENGKVTSFYGLFSGCISLQSIPEHLFDFNSGVTQFDYAFQKCSELQAIPVGLFNSNREATGFNRTFANCSSLQSIPADLFKENVKAEGFDLVFSECTSLKSIPVGLFNSNREVTSFYRTFAGCTLLQTIPADLFQYNEKVTNFSFVFANCSSLQ